MDKSSDDITMKATFNEIDSSRFLAREKGGIDPEQYESWAYTWERCGVWLRRPSH